MTEDGPEMRALGLSVGEQIPPFVRTTGFAQWNRYAAVNDEFVPIHMDDAAGREAGYPSAIGMGNLQWAFLHNVLREWMGDDGRIEQVACQFRSPNLKDQTVVRPRTDRVHPPRRRPRGGRAGGVDRGGRGRPVGAGNGDRLVAQPRLQRLMTPDTRREE